VWGIVAEFTHKHDISQHRLFIQCTFTNLVAEIQWVRGFYRSWKTVKSQWICVVWESQRKVREKYYFWKVKEN